MFSELGVALEAAGIAVPQAGNADLTGIETVADLETLIRQWGFVDKKKKPAASKTGAPSGDGAAGEIVVPESLAQLGHTGLRWAQRMTYERLFHTTVTGRAHIPGNTSFIVAANHASHLDMGLVKHALGDWGPHLVALAARDYFFADPLRRAYFENFTNLVPMDRHGSLRESLRLASEVVKQGYILLIFPEGTRSTDGVMVDFKPAIGYLALSNKIDVLPMYLDGTHDALPKGGLWPKHRDLAARIGPLLRYADLRRDTDGMPRSEAYKETARLVELAVRRLAPPRSVNRQPPSPPPRRLAVPGESAMTDPHE
jgi:long-chain acyl-CoA synthetase